MISSRDVLLTARGWLGVPVAHQGARKDTGCDCIGLVRGVGTELAIFPEDFWSLPGAARWKAYGREPVGTFLEALGTVFPEGPGFEPGGIVAMRFTGRPRHCAIVGDHPHGGFTFIHALHNSVIEHRMDPRWEKRVVAFYRFPGVTYEH
jgi:cell wall-associated NlpC family hydrolase